MIKKYLNKNFNKIDKLITGLIIWWAISWILFSKRKSVKNKMINSKKQLWTLFRWIYSKFWKWLVFIINNFHKK